MAAQPEGLPTRSSFSLSALHKKTCESAKKKKEENGALQKSKIFSLRLRGNRFPFFGTRKAMTGAAAQEEQFGGSRLSLIDCLASSTSETSTTAAATPEKSDKGPFAFATPQNHRSHRTLCHSCKARRAEAPLDEIDAKARFLGATWMEAACSLFALFKMICPISLLWPWGLGGSFTSESKIPIFPSERAIRATPVWLAAFFSL